METFGGQLLDYINVQSSTEHFTRNEFYATDEQKSVKSDKSSINSDYSVVRRNDMYCWICHRESEELLCNTCIRVYHHKCLQSNGVTNANVKPFVCPECVGICNAEEDNNPLSGCMSWLNGQVNQLADLLKYAMATIKAADQNKMFHRAVSDKEYPDYLDVIVNPMDLSKIERNVRKGKYASTHSFLAHIKWIHHNCVIYNHQSGHAYIKQSQNMMRVARQECSEIEICPDCYKNYYDMEETTYFAEPCRKPHAIVWAKLSGHPFWPAKVVKFDSVRDQLDIRFFGTHDKCWLSPRQCYLMSKSYPNHSKPSKFDETKFNEAIQDMNIHLDRLEIEYPGVFKFWPIKTVFEPKYLYLTDQPIDTKLMKTHNGVPLKNLRVKTSTFDFNFGKSKIDLISDEQDLGINGFEKHMSKISSLSSSISSSVSSKHSDSCNNSNSVVDTNDQNEDSTAEMEIDEQDIDLCQNILEEASSSHKLPIINANDSNSENISVLMDDFGDINSDSCAKSSKTFTFSEKSNQSVINISQKKKQSIKQLFKNKTKLVNKNETNCNDITNAKYDNLDKLNILDKCIQVSLMDKHEQDLNKRIRELEAERDRYLKQSENDRENHNKQLLDASKRLDEAKRKQWCVNCLKEAILPCCWNTSYCTVECQHTHWPIHMKTCRRRQRTAQQQTNI